MLYKCTQDVVKDLELAGQLIRIKEEVSPDGVMAEIQRQAYSRGLGAVLFENVKGSPFPAVSNLYGTHARTEYLFRQTLPGIMGLFALKTNPWKALKCISWVRTFKTIFHALPLPTLFRSPSMWGECKLSDLPQIKSWPKDGGAFVTLPQVFSEHPSQPGIWGSNLGMYRIQISGGSYVPEKEVGLHYQIHRGLGIHHTAALEAKLPLKVAIWVGGPPAHAFAAVMPLPEGMSELMFAGMFAGRNFRYKRWNGYVISSDADFCILGELEMSGLKPEGPFGDHLGYYSLKHDFPYLKVEKVFHRKNAIWPFTVVGRPPQEDTSFGHLIHKVTQSLVPSEIPGVKALHAVDEAGVHPLLLAIGSERYTPFAERRPMELHTIAHRILGFGQCSLAKYLFLVAGEDQPLLDVSDVSSFFQHFLERVDLENDLHFETRTTIDTLDYSGEGLNRGSKLFITACGKKKRELFSDASAIEVSGVFKEPRCLLPGVLLIQGPAFEESSRCQVFEDLSTQLQAQIAGFPLLVLVDDSPFASESLANFLWITFTRSNPSMDVYGVGGKIIDKHFSAGKAMVIDARIKPHHAPALEVSPEVSSLAAEILSRSLG